MDSELLTRRLTGIHSSLDVLSKKIFRLQQSYDAFVPETDSEKRVFDASKAANLKSFILSRVPSNYYSWSLNDRRIALGASTIDSLCKSIIVENSSWPESTLGNLDSHCKNKSNSRFYCVIIQYTARLNGHKLFKMIRNMNPELAKTKFHFVLANESDSLQLTGFGHNGITPVGSKVAIPLILSHKIAELQPPFFWMGGGEVNTKLGMEVKEFIEKFDPFIGDVTSDSNSNEDSLS